MLKQSRCNCFPLLIHLLNWNWVCKPHQLLIFSCGAQPHVGFMKNINYMLL